MEEKFTSVEEISDKIEGFTRLKGVVQLDYEGVRNLLHNVPLNLRIRHLVVANDEVFL